MESTHMVLYYKPPCPFCVRVINFLEKHDIQIPLKNTLEAGVREELISIGGKGQVPSLVIDGKPLYESDAIIEYLTEKFLQ